MAIPRRTRQGNREGRETGIGEQIHVQLDRPWLLIGIHRDSSS